MQDKWLKGMYENTILLRSKGESKEGSKKVRRRRSIVWGCYSSKSKHVLNFVFLSGKTFARRCRRCMPSEY
jgi:hypothetical protein